MNVKKYSKPAALFAITVIYTLLIMFVDKKPIGPEGTSVGFAAVNGFFHNMLPYNHTFYIISYALLFIGFAAVFVFAVVGIMQLVKRKSLLKVDRYLLGLGVLYIAVLILYVAFEKIPINYRPMIVPGETELETSYPSSHTFAFCSICLSAVYVFKYMISDVKMRRILSICSFALMVVGVLSRFLSGVHWFTDIVGGILFSVTMVSLYVAWDAD